MIIPTEQFFITFLISGNYSCTKGKRQKYEHGIASKAMKDGGVKKLVIIGLVPDVDENYRNLLLCWVKIGLSDISLPYTIATDLKMANILIGLMSHGCNHPCTWCNISKCDLLNGKCGDLRTLGSLSDLYWAWFDSGSEKSSAKSFGNVIHPCIIKGDMNKLILDLIPAPYDQNIYSFVQSIASYMAYG